MDILKLAKEKLSKVELGFFQLMVAQSGVLFIKGRPGTAKSAILRAIAAKLDMVFIDLRLPTMDEIDLGVYPVLAKSTGKEYEVLRHAVPEWAEMTTDSSKNFLIVFEELNRAQVPQRNAALGLLNERIIGHNFKFGNNVFMAATGNLGSTEDGSDVEEFDSALKGRLITVEHTLEYVAWKEMWATANIHPDVIRFLDNRPECFYPSQKDQGDNKDVITSPRTWSFLSAAIIANFGKDSTVDEYGDWLSKYGKYYIGSRASRFHTFLTETRRIKLVDVLAGRVKKYEKINRENRAELLESLVEYNWLDISKKDFVNVMNLLKSFRGVDSDLLTGKVVDWMIKTKKQFVQDKSVDSDKANGQIIKNPNFVAIMEEFEPEIRHARANFMAKDVAKEVASTKKGK